jgi:hypothetical protein
MENTSFDQWALVELFGHTKIAGRVTEQTIAGGALVRVDVPETKSNPAFTRFFGISAIYSINPVTEDVAKHIADQISVKPIDVWDIREYISKAKALAMSNQDED